MVKDKNMIPLLLLYDAVGPMIAQNIRNDSFKRTRSLVILELYIKPICDLLENKLYSDAIIKYEKMTRSLMDSYNIPDIDINVDDVYLDNIGKGHKIKYKNKEI